MKTIKQLAKEYANSRGSELLSSMDIEMAFENGVAAAQKWIRKEEELPNPTFSPILVRLKGGEIAIANYSPLWKSWSYLESSTHWRPIDIK